MNIYGIKLNPFTIYNVKCGVWHTHTLSKDASVLIVENQNTSDINSSRSYLKEKERIQIINIANKLFSK